MLGLGEGPVGKVCVMQIWGPEFNPQNPGRKPGMEAHTYNSSAGETDPGGFMELAAQPV